MKKTHSYHIEYSSSTDFIKIENETELNQFLKSEIKNPIFFIDQKLKINLNFSNCIQLISGEELKSFDFIQEVLIKLSSVDIDRHSTFVAIGGGAISDFVGFLASIYYRGISLVIIPSTLLSIVDASIGGKNGINFLNKKNQLGTIYQPKFILQCHWLFNTLSDNDISDGFSEIIKYAFTFESKLYNLIHKSNVEEFKINNVLSNEIIFQCIQIKSGVIERDVNEKSERKILNFGHTIGHALESLYKLSHGQAIALGMIFATKLSENIYKLNTDISIQLKNLLIQYSLPIIISEFNPDDIYNQVLSDKKRLENQIDFICISKIGSAHIVKLNFVELKKYLELAKSERWILA